MDHETLRSFLMREIGGTEEPVIPDRIDEDVHNFLEHEHLVSLQTLGAVEDFCLRVSPSFRQRDLAKKIGGYYEARGYAVRDLWGDGSGLAATRGEGATEEGFVISSHVTDGGRVLVTVMKQ